MTRRSLRGRRTGVLGLTLALVLLVGLVVPAYADYEGPPLLPHLFAGTVSTQGGSIVAEGTLVQALLDGVETEDTTTVGANGRYQLVVHGDPVDAGKTVTFKVGGVLANETAIWTEAEENQNFNLTVPGGSSFPLPLPFDCFVATAVYGTDTAEEIGVLKEFRDAVLLPSKLGAGFVALYYEVSPPIAEVIARNDFLRTALRLGFIDPVVAVLNWSHRFWTEGER